VIKDWRGRGGIRDQRGGIRNQNPWTVLSISTDNQRKAPANSLTEVGYYFP